MKQKLWTLAFILGLEDMVGFFYSGMERGQLLFLRNKTFHTTVSHAWVHGMLSW